FYLFTFCAVDIATSWVELQPLWGKGHYRVTAAVHEMRGRLPVLLRGVDSDNGSEFINRPLYYYCGREGITFTRSRAWKKNDSAHVEQKNGAVVRHLVGYDRLASKRAYAQTGSRRRPGPPAREFLPARRNARDETARRRPRPPGLRSPPDALSASARRGRVVARETRRARGALPSAQ